jgi:hypothetical protein
MNDETPHVVELHVARNTEIEEAAKEAVDLADAVPSSYVVVLVFNNERVLVSDGFKYKDVVEAYNRIILRKWSRNYLTGDER